MNRILTLLIAVFTAIIAQSNNNIESFNVISDNIENSIQDAQIVRSINGGSVIIPIFDESCPEQIKAPFSFAAKIVEEYLPPCLPLRVKVSSGEINGSSSNVVSKVLARSKENFGNSEFYNNAQMSVIKGVILSELCYNSTITYLDSVPNIEFLTTEPDIEITYNSQRLNEMSFSLAPDPGQNYDFVSLVIRDLFIGLGLSSSYRINQDTKELLNPSHEFTPFECFIDRMLGSSNTDLIRLANACKGELLLKDYSTQSLKLYAPRNWQNGISLNYFIPQEDCCVSNILSYNFCKGMVTRSLSDNYSEFIFEDLLGWRPNFLIGGSTPSSYAAGSTSMLMPYNGSITFNDNSYGIKTIVNSDSCIQSISSTDPLLSNDYEELHNYINSFHPFLYNGTTVPAEGISISVLKKDGSWDLVKFIGMYIDDISFYMSDWEFHYDESEYARTIDGYLRGRITTKEPEYGSGIKYVSKYFVIDYLPQKINLSYTFEDSSLTRATSNNIKIYFSNTEGLNRIVLEKLRQGARVPSKIEISDLKKGYFETTIDRTTTFTAVGYNNNGTSRGNPITISPQLDSSTPSLTFIIKNNSILIESEVSSEMEYDYCINSLDALISQPEQMGTTSGQIDISSLSTGLYSLKVTDDSGFSNYYKFRK